MRYFPFSIFNFPYFTLVSKFTISGHSMEPTLRSGSSVLVSSLPYLFISPKIGDIIAANIEGKVFIKRISVREKNVYFLLGDNSEDSRDSRKFGMIGRDQIIGKVIYS